MRQEFQMQITDLAFGGDGVGRIDNMVCFVPYTVPEDVARVEVTERKKNFLRGRTLEIIHPSPWRTDPVCPHFGVCGGCYWQHVKYERQLTAKQNHLKNILRKITGIDAEVGEVLPSEKIYHYRRSGRLQVSPGGSLGFFRSGSTSVVPIRSCPIFEEALNSALPAIEAELKTLRPLPVEVEIESRDGLHADYSFLYPGDHSQQGFIQANRHVNTLLQTYVRSRIAESVAAGDPAASGRSSGRSPDQSSAPPSGQSSDAAHLVLDLYCGDGNLSLPLHGLPVHVRGYDISAPAVARARAEAAARDLSHFVYSQSALQAVLEEIIEHREKVAAVICDPPRQGLGAMSSVMASIRAPLFVYISCIPAILARDLQVFLKSGYILRDIQPMDMFPHTFHLETAAVLELDGGGDP